MKPNLLLIDPVEESLTADAGVLADSGFTVFKASGSEDMNWFLDSESIDIVLCSIDDYKEKDFPDILRNTLSHRDIPVLFRADNTCPAFLNDSITLPSYGYITRSGISPVQITAIKSAIRKGEAEKNLLETMKREKELFNLFLEYCPEYVFFKDDEIRTLKLSKNYEKMLGKPLNELLGKTMFDLFPSDLGASMDADDRALLDSGRSFEIEEELNGKHYLTRKFPIKRKNGSSLLAGFTIDITRRVMAEKQLEELATRDSLTGLFNRRHILHLGDMILKDSIRAGLPLGIIMVDVDFFKNYNDTFGHQAGDECLKKVTEIMSRVLSRNNDIIGRYGGEEFVAVLFNTDAESLQMLTEKLCQQVRSAGIPHSTSSVSEFVTVSAGGISQSPDEKTTLYEMIKKADTALYQAKTSGRNRAVLI